MRVSRAYFQLAFLPHPRIKHGAGSNPLPLGEGILHRSPTTVHRPAGPVSRYPEPYSAGSTDHRRKDLGRAFRIFDEPPEHLVAQQPASSRKPDPGRVVSDKPRRRHFLDCVFERVPQRHAESLLESCVGHCPPPAACPSSSRPPSRRFETQARSGRLPPARAWLRPDGRQLHWDGSLPVGVACSPSAT